MLIQDLSTLEGIARPDGVIMTNFFGYDVPAGGKVKVGHGVFPPGTIVPPASHDEDEYSFILSGTVKARVGDTVHVLTTGCCGFIPAGEVHSSSNDSDKPCHLVWMLIEK